MVKMATPDMPGGVGADIGVTLSEHNLEKYSDVIENLHIGDHVAFNSTLLSLGDKHHLHHLREFNIEKIDGHMDVQAQTCLHMDPLSVTSHQAQQRRVVGSGEHFRGTSASMLLCNDKVTFFAYNESLIRPLLH